MRYRPRNEVLAIQAPPTPGDALAELLIIEVPKLYGLRVERHRSYYAGSNSTTWEVDGDPVPGRQGLRLNPGDWLVIDDPDSDKPSARTLSAERFAEGFDLAPDDDTRRRMEDKIVGAWARSHFAIGAISLDWLDGGFAANSVNEPLWQHPAAQAEVDHVRATLRATGARWYQPVDPDEAARWNELRAGLPVAVRVEPQLHNARLANTFTINQPRHIVPEQDFRGPRRAHRAGLPLCVTPARKTPLPLAGPSTGTPSCEKCLLQLQPRSDEATATSGNGGDADRDRGWTTGVDPVWDGLNPRQKHYLEVFFHQDQAAERQHNSGHWMDRPRGVPASEWRQLTFDIDLPKNSKTGEGYSAIQHALRERGVHDPGAGSTLSALVDRDLIVVTYDTVMTPFGLVDRIRVRLTNLGRKVARAGLGITVPATKPRGLLTEWGWRVLARLYAAGEDGLPDGYDVPWKDRLPQQVVQNLEYRPDQHALVQSYVMHEPYERTDHATQRTTTGYHRRDRVRCTPLGKLHYEIHHRCYAELYPEIDALDPDQPHPHAHADLAAHNARPGRDLVLPQDIRFYLDLLEQAESSDPWPRRVLVKQYADRKAPVPQEILGLPGGLWLNRAKGQRGNSTTVERLMKRHGGALVELVDVPFDDSGTRRELVTLTELGRRHAEEHQAEYQRLYPEEFARSTWRSKQHVGQNAEAAG
ncbi:hypothetical protein SUDANB95_07932 (plasmid) [Actinosynnema sp. ALI-1.44]